MDRERIHAEHVHGRLQIIGGSQSSWSERQSGTITVSDGTASATLSGGATVSATISGGTLVTSNTGYSLRFRK